LYGFQPGIFFTIKCYLINHPFISGVSLLSFTVFVFSYTLRIYELPYFRLEDDAAVKNCFDSLFNAMYVTVITFTSVGYGDISTGTPVGRFIIMILCIWGAFQLSLLVVLVNRIFDLQNEEKLATFHITQLRSASSAI